MVGSQPILVQTRSVGVRSPTTFHIAPGHWAGHGRIYHRICMSLAHAGYAVHLAAHPSANGHISSEIQFHSLGNFGKATLSWRLTQRLRRSERAYQLAIRSNADLFHFYAPEFIPWAVRLRRKTKRPVIFDCMEDFEGYALQRRGIPDRLREPLARLVRAQLHYAVRNVDAVVVSDAGTGKLLEPHARRVHVVHNYPQLALFPDPKDRDDTKQFDLTYHGSIPRYHLEVCFAIDEVLVARGRHVSWRFIGRLSEKEWFIHEATRRNASHRFVYTDLVAHDQVADEVLKARIGIIPLPSLPKFQHNIPQKLFEFMALRMPVVLSDLPPSRPFVGDGACAFMVKPDDASAYADAILRLLDNPALCQQMGTEARRRVERMYNWERESSRLLDLYAELLEQ